MANFRVWPGRWVLITQDYKFLKKGNLYQMLNTPNLRLDAYTFVGVPGYFMAKELAKIMEPAP